MTPPVDPVMLKALRTRYREGKAELIAQFMQERPSGRSAQRLLKGLARHVDQTLQELLSALPVPEGLALVAVGGYGRGELFPHSDVDVLVLLPQAASTDGVADFITACWDTGLEIGSSVRTVEECVAEAERDVTVQTALLESRLVAGKRRLFERFRAATSAVLDPRAFLRAKTLEMQQRHVKYESTPYSLEPNCKESPGGLRDLHTMIWLARAAGLGSSWQALAGKGLITDFERRQLEDNEALLSLIRARLHAVAGRHEDRLVFDQHDLARACGGCWRRAGGLSLVDRASSIPWQIQFYMGPDTRLGLDP